MKKFLLMAFIILSLQLASAVTIFSDDFESGNINAWNKTNVAGARNWTANQTDPFQGLWHAQSQPTSTSEPASVLSINVSTLNYQNISLFYYRRLVGIDAADEFQVEWFNGTTWAILESTGGASANDASYLVRNFNLTSIANNNQKFQIKFECTAGATSEFCRVDNVTITGSLIQDTIPPIVNLIAPINNTITKFQTHSFNATFSDNIALANSTYYLWNSTNSQINITPQALSGLIGSINLTINLPYEDKFTWNYLAADTSNNLAFNLTNFTILYDATQPSINYAAPTQQSGTIKNSNFIEINITAADLHIQALTISLFNSTKSQIKTNITNNSLFYINYSNLQDGLYFYNASANDTAGNINNLETRNITIDTTPPKVTQPTEFPTDPSNYLQNQIYQFNTTITDLTQIQSVKLEFNGTNYTANNIAGNIWNVSIYNLQAGIFNYKWYANDTLGNLNNTESSTYTINKAQSEVNLTLNKTEGNITIIAGTSILLNGTLTIGDSSAALELYKNGTLINQGISSLSNLTNFTIPGLYNITVIYASSQNYTSSLETYFVNVTSSQDAAPPYFTIIPNNASINYTQGFQINFEAGDNIALDSFSINWTTYFEINKTGSLKNTTKLAAGTYLINVTINDTLNNKNSTIYQVIVNKIQSQVNTFLNNSRSNITILQNIAIYINSTLITGEGIIKLYNNNSLINQGPSPLSNLTNFTILGAYNITTIYEETQNYTPISDTFYVSVISIPDTTFPLISIIQPQNATYNTNFLQINFTISDTNLNSCWYTDNNGQTNTTLTNCQNTSYTANQGSTTIKLYANDSANNINNSEQLTFFVDSVIPLISFTSPTQSNNSVIPQNSVFINTTIAETNFANITFTLHNSTSLVNISTFTSQTQSINFTSLQDGIYFYNATIKDVLSNQNTTETRTLRIDTSTPSIQIINPTNNTTYKNSSVLINISSNGQSTWFYNGTANETYTFPIYKSFQEGTNTIISYANNSAGTLNSASLTFFINTLILTCEVGGPYQQDALILVQGNLKNETSNLNAQTINISIYKNNLLNISKTAATSNNGNYETTFSNLTVGNYIINTTASYLGLNITCSDSFQIGSSASFILDKTATIDSTTNSTIYYNITLKLTNKGGSDALNTNITDSDSESSFYIIGALSLSSSYQISYLKNFTRQSSTTYYETSIAAAQGIDSYSNSLLKINSTQINLTIPPTSTGKQIIILKNILYLSETNLNVTYNITSTLYNSGDEDLIDITYIDTDISSTAILLNLTKGSSKQFANNLIIAKAASNTQHEFALGTATISSLSFYSNRPKINIPGYGGPADVIVYAPSSLNPSISFDSIIEIKNINLDIGQDFPIDYWITNNDETQNSSSGQKTIYVGANSTINTTVTLASPSAAGVYKLKALAVWAGGSASAFDSFDVISTQTPSATNPESSSQGAAGNSIVSPPVKKPTPEQKERTEEKQKEVEIICNTPYIRHGVECCLDQNNNNICDEDEKSTPEEPKKQGFLTTITGFITNNIININIVNKIIIPIILIILIILIALYLIKRINKRPKDTKRLKTLIGLKVYTSEGIEIGRIREIFIENHRIHSIQIKLSKKLKKNKKIKANGITIKYKHVQNIKQIAIINEKILEKIK